MENSNLLLTYLAILLVLLSIAAFFVVRQVFKTRRIETTLSKLQSRLTKEKGTAQDYYELGSLLLDKKLYTQAALYLQQALKQVVKDESENTAVVYNALGYAYFAQEQYDLAIRNYKEALKVSPGYVTALNNLGHSYERKQLMTQALESYESALALEPTNATAKRRAESLQKRLVISDKLNSGS
ncbi:MAG: tetratricopeptide repeat protein [Nodosilinea sp.]